MLAYQTLNTRSNSKIIVYNISLPNRNAKFGSKNKRDTYIFFLSGADQAKGGEPRFFTVLSLVHSIFNFDLS
jgi:hypothetical protein